ncbi:uncharacterized protein [Eulemur rufifrons]|uniref:uncharacterized protein n=1 Tax=Eulemur rufifrons TaxID=859984 RepID=UPI0037440570
MPGSDFSLLSPPPPSTLCRRPLRQTPAHRETRVFAIPSGPHPFPVLTRDRAGGKVNGKMEMDVEGVSPRPEPIPRSQGAGGACQAPPQPPQPQPQQQQQLAQNELPGESAGAEDSDDPETRPNGEKGESKYFVTRSTQESWGEAD